MGGGLGSSVAKASYLRSGGRVVEPWPAGLQKHLSLAVPLSTQANNWKQVNCWGQPEKIH